MFNSFTKTLSKITWRWLKPVALVESVLGSCKLASNKLSSAENLLINNMEDLRPTTGEFTIDVKLSNISDLSIIYANKNVKADASGSIVANAPSGIGNFKYCVKNLKQGITAIGKSQESDLKLKFIDFYEENGLYYFKDNPQTFGNLSTRESISTISFYTVGSRPVIKHANRFFINHKNITSDINYLAVTRKDKGVSLLGHVSSVFNLLLSGLKPASVSSKVMQISKEFGKNVVYTDKEDLLLADNLDKDLRVNSSIEKGYCAESVDSLYSVCLVPTSNGCYWFSKDDRYVNSTVTQEIIKTLPTISTTEINGSEIINAATAKGISTILSTNPELDSSGDLIRSRLLTTYNSFITRKVSFSLTNKTAVDNETKLKFLLLYTTNKNVNNNQYAIYDTNANITKIPSLIMNHITTLGGAIVVTAYSKFSKESKTYYRFTSVPAKIYGTNDKTTCYLDGIVVITSKKSLENSAEEQILDYININDYIEFNNDLTLAIELS